MRRTTILVVLVMCLALLATGCGASYTVVPESDYRSIGAKEGSYNFYPYVFHTRDGGRYVAKDFKVTEAGVTIYEIEDQDSATDKLDKPIELEWENITKIEKIDLRRGRTFVALVLVTAFIVIASISLAVA